MNRKGMRSCCYSCTHLTVDWERKPRCRKGREVFAGVKTFCVDIHDGGKVVSFAEGRKACTCCQKLLPVREFYTRPQSKDGYEGYCKACHKVIQLERLTIKVN